MKKAFSILLFVVLVSIHVKAQDQLIAYFESDFILSKMPEYNGIEQRLTLLSESWQAEIASLENEIQQLEQDFNAKEILYTDEIRAQKRTEIKAKINAKDAYIAQKFGPEGEFFSRQKELLEPIQRQVFAAVRAVAQRRGIDFVFDRSGDIYMVYARGEWNLNEDILLELGIEIDN